MFKKLLKWCLIAFGCLVLFVVGLIVWAFLDPANGIDALQISKETTYITEPLKADGTVDYIAALNQQCSQGVTPENNFAVVLLEVFGPSEIERELREKYFLRLGMDVLPEEGDYLVELPEFAELHPELALEESPRELKELEKKPDASDIYSFVDAYPVDLEKYPVAAAWMKAMEGHLDRIVEGTKRTKFYSPLLPDDEDAMMVGVLLPTLQPTREVARLLSIRARYRIFQGQAEEAWQDILAIYRLSQLTSQYPTLIGRLVAISIKGTAFDTLDPLLQSSNLTAEQIKRFRTDLADIPDLPSVVDSFNTSERYMFLDCVTTLASGEVSLTSLEPSDDTGMFGAMADTFNWNLVLRRGNAFYDNIVESLTDATYEESLELAVEEIEQIEAMSRSARHLPTKVKAIFSTDARSTLLSNLLLTMFMPASDAYSAQIRAQQYTILADTALAIAAYRAEQGSYPEKLEQLVPQYIKEVPQDLFTLEPLIYKRGENGVLIYSVGRDQSDNGGLEPERPEKEKYNPYWQSNTPVDDVAIRIGDYPRPKLPQPGSADQPANDVSGEPSAKPSSEQNPDSSNAQNKE